MVRFFAQLILCLYRKKIVTFRFKNPAKTKAGRIDQLKRAADWQEKIGKTGWAGAMRREAEFLQAQIDLKTEKQTAAKEAAAEKRKLAREKVLEEKRALLERERAKAAPLRAAVAAAVGKSRDHAQTIRAQIPITDICPYCGSGLNGDAHLDHIYPVSKGGHSNSANLVWVCASCNIKKGAKTLSAFIKEFGLDRDRIEQSLDRLSKEY